MPQNKLRCAIVGYGYMGEIRRAVIERNPQLTLVAIADNNPQTLAKISDIKTTTQYRDLFDLGIDILFVCTPNCFSPQICIEAMSRQIHVFCEKPPGRDVPDIESIRQEELKSPKVKLMFGFNHRWHPGILKAKVIIDSGRFGRMINMRGIYGKSGGLSFKRSWRNDRSVSGGGILLDQGIHMLDLFRFFAGDFTTVKCIASNGFWNLDVEDNAFVALKGVDGVDAMLHSSATFWRHSFRIHLTLEGGYLIVEGLLSKTGSYGREQLIVAKRQFEDEADAVGNPSEEITYFDKDMSWDMEVKEFVSCIVENKPVSQASSMDALRVMQLIERAYVDAGLMIPSKEKHEEHRRS